MPMLRACMIAAGLLPVALAWPGAAGAQEYCVSCSEPAGVYRCVIDGARPGGPQSLQMMCVTAMANSGGHASCAVKGGTVFECNGPVKRVQWGGADAPKVVEPPKAKPEADPDAPPKTLLEAAKRANEQNAEQMKKAGENVKSAGDAIGNATKKTLDCIASLFKEC